MNIPGNKKHVFLQADSSQAEARVVFLLANDEQALEDIDKHDYHALTASWFFGGSEDDYSKKKLGFESPIRFAGKTLRHAGHLGAGKRRAATSVNTDARKYKVKDTNGNYFRIEESFADRALKIFHSKQPKIQQVFQKGIIDCLQNHKRFLVSAVPFGIQSKIGGKRQFFERWGEELFRVAFSYIPQRSVSDNTKAAMLRIRASESRAFELGIIRIIMESHDAILFSIQESELPNLSPLVKEEMERPLRFDTCSLARRDLIIPCELEVGYNYQELKKFNPVIKSTKQDDFSIPLDDRDIKPMTLKEKMFQPVEYRPAFIPTERMSVNETSNTTDDDIPF